MDVAWTMSNTDSGLQIQESHHRKRLPPEDILKMIRRLRQESFDTRMPLTAEQNQLLRDRWDEAQKVIKDQQACRKEKS